MTSPDTNDTVRLREMMRGHIITQLVASAVRLKLPEMLAEGPQTTQHLSRQTDVDAEVLARYLRALEALGIVERVGPALYRGTNLCTLLRREGVHFGNALMSGGDYYAAWADLDYSLKTGKSAFEHRWGETLWERFSKVPEVAESFTRTMRANTRHVVDEVLAACDLPDEGVIADLGAGDGSLLATILSLRPKLSGLAVEQATVVGHTQKTLEERGVAKRCTVVAGDLLSSVPTGASVYLLKAVVHNWNDESAGRILRHTRAAMGAQGRLLVIERALDEKNPNHLGTAILDLTMLVLFGARDRTVEDYRALIERSGFVVGRITTTASGTSILDAKPVDSVPNS